MNLKRPLTVLLLGLAMSTVTFAQDPATSAIALGRTDLPEGFTLRQTGPGAILVGQTEYATLVQWWVTDEESITCKYAVLSTDDEAVQAFAHLRLQGNGVGVYPDLVGDSAVGMLPDAIVFTVGRAVVAIYVQARTREEREALLLPLLERAEQKVLAAGFTPRPPFSVQFEPLSTTVNRATGQAAHLLIRADGAGRVRYDYRIASLEESGEFVLMNRDLPVDQGVGELIWDGTDPAGNPVPDGRYQVMVSVKDGLMRAGGDVFQVTVTSSPEGGSSALLATRDTFLLEREPHRNEGANDMLALRKITGKPARPVVGFDLSGVSITGLSRATLVLTVAPGESPTGWGNGRTLSVRRLLEPWAEGNGRQFPYPPSHQTGGSGEGATWFSPLDADISDDGPGGFNQWNGGDLGADAPTAPRVTMTNHFTGEVRFDVTADMLQGAEHGWLVVRDNENVGSEVHFCSREGAALVGDPELAPRLILDFGGSASTVDTRAVTLAPVEPKSELGVLTRGLGYMLAEELISVLAHHAWLDPLSGRLLFRLWTASASVA